MTVDIQHRLDKICEQLELLKKAVLATADDKPLDDLFNDTQLGLASVVAIAESFIARDRVRRNLCEYRGYRTVRYDPGRQTGKSTAIRNLIQLGDLVVCRSTTQVSFFQSHTSSIVTHNNTAGLASAAAKHFSRVWIDDASTLSPSDLERIYIAFEGKYPMFILVG